MVGDRTRVIRLIVAAVGVDQVDDAFYVALRSPIIRHRILIAGIKVMLKLRKREKEKTNLKTAINAAFPNRTRRIGTRIGYNISHFPRKACTAYLTLP